MTVMKQCQMMLVNVGKPSRDLPRRLGGEKFKLLFGQFTPSNQPNYPTGHRQGAFQLALYNGWYLWASF